MKYNREKLHNLISLLSDREALDMMLMLESTRPACLIMDPSDEACEYLINLCNTEELCFRQETGGKSNLSKKGFFIAKDESRMHLIESEDGRFYGLSDKKVGEFLGFPKESIEYFQDKIQDGPIEPELRSKIDEMISNGEISQKQAKISKIVSYVPKPCKENILKAVEHGKTHVRNLNEFDSRENCNIGSQVLENFYNNSMGF